MSSRFIQALVIDPTTPDTNGVREIHADLVGLQQLVGGHLEAAYGYRFPDGELNDIPRVTFYINEEGKIHGLPANRLATALWWHYNPAAARRDIRVGTAVILGGANGHGHDTRVPDDVVDVYNLMSTQ